MPRWPGVVIVFSLVLVSIWRIRTFFGPAELFRPFNVELALGRVLAPQDRHILGPANLLLPLAPMRFRPLSRDPFTDTGRAIPEFRYVGLAERKEFHGFSVDKNNAFLRSIAKFPDSCYSSPLGVNGTGRRKAPLP